MELDQLFRNASAWRIDTRTCNHLTWVFSVKPSRCGKQHMVTCLIETRYLHNVVEEAKIEKGEGMELDQLFRCVENRHPDLQPFDMGILGEVFKMRETTYGDLSYAEKGTGRKMYDLNGDFVVNKKHVKREIRDKDKSMVHTRRHHQKDSGTRKDDGKTSQGHHHIDPDNLQKLPDKRKFGVDDFSSVQRHQKTKVKLASAHGLHFSLAEELKGQENRHVKEKKLDSQKASNL
ncbi:uncharacterized protein LOC141718952 isoform X2 [Apium graveolens]|uniref:uncharacterized protein LOC141718952 isoform X2 n=1 Tax=Apium graveolens TaxID=4045 RepID=UPI003D797C2C